MDAIEHPGLGFTEDFRIACALNQLRPVEVLQYFVNRVSFYAFIDGQTEPVSLLATRVVADCRQVVNPEVISEPDPKVYAIFIKYMTALSALAGNHTAFVADLLRQSFNLIQDWEKELSPLVSYPRTFYLDEDHFLILPFDYNLLCSITGLATGQLLQYFIDHISLAAQRAVNLVEVEKTNSAMALFGTLVMARSMKGLEANFAECTKGYASQLLALDDQLTSESDYQKRVTAYSAFYLRWYQELSPFYLR